MKILSKLTYGEFSVTTMQIDDNVQREIINHRSLRHPNIVKFKEVSSTEQFYCLIA